MDDFASSPPPMGNIPSRRCSLKTRITFLTLIIFLTVLWSLAFYGSHVLRNNLQHLVGEQQFSTVSIVAEEINERVDFRLRSLESTALEIGPRLMLNQHSLQSFLEKSHLLKSLFNGGYFVTSLDGTATASVPVTLDRVGLNYRDRDYIADAVSEGRTNVSKPFMGRAMHAPVVCMAAPIRDAGGRIIGALAGVVDLSKPNFLDHLAGNRYGKTGEYLLVSPQHKLFITGSDRSRIMQPTPAPGLNPLYDRYAQGYEGSGMVKDARGVEVVSAAKSIPAAGWVIVARIPSKEAFAPIKATQDRLVLAAVLLTVLAGGLTWWTLRRQLWPMLDAVERLSLISGSTLLPAPLPVTRHDEVGQLITAFNNLLETLTRREANLRESEERHRTILQTATSGICLTDLRGRFLEVNKAYCKKTGYSEAELLRMGVQDLEVNDSADLVATRIQEIKEVGEALFESRHRRKDGTIIDIEVSIQYRPDNGGQLIAFVRNITERKNTEKSLKESEERLKFALEGTGDGLWDWDPASNRIYFSREWTRMLGYSEADIVGTVEDWNSRMHPDDKETVYADLERHLCGKTETFLNEHRIRCKDGSYKWVLSRGKVIERTDDGKPCRVIGMLTDISQRKRIEGYRRMGQDILLVLNEQDNLKEAIYRIIVLMRAATGVDAVGVRLQEGEDFPYFCQDGFPEDFVLKENSLIGRTRDGGICLDSNGGICLECTCGLVIAGKTDFPSPNFTSGGSAWSNDSFPAIHVPAEADPRTHPRNECIHQGFASVALIPIRAKGRIVGLLQLNDRRKGCFTLEEIETLEEIAESIGEALLRKQAEEKLIASELFLRTLTNQLPGMVSYWDEQLRCRLANNVHREWVGKAPENLIGITLQELTGNELFREKESHVCRALQGESQQFEGTFVKATGKTGYTWEQYIPDVVNGKARGFFVLISDVTELKKAQEEKVKLETQLLHAQKMESIGRLAGGVAHDFNNMLTAILGHTEIALRHIDPSLPACSSIKKIGKAAERSADLTRQLLAFARKQTISPEVIDINGVVAGMLSILQRLIGENIQLVWKPAEHLWPVLMDTSQLDQIMANLCVNSSDAIGDVGRIVIETLDCSINEDHRVENSCVVRGDFVRISVRDDGIGMTPETLEHVFEPFFTTKDVGKGTGLGLATVYGIVQQNNGFIDVQSAPESGTTFNVYLPRYEGDKLVAVKEAASGSLKTGYETVLLVEDDPSILETVSTVLTEVGYNVLEAGSPGEAIKLTGLHDGDIHLLISDVIMPDMNGRDLAKKLASSHPQMKCLFMSGYTADIIATHGVLNDGVHFIQKPFRMEALCAKLREMIG